VIIDVSSGRDSLAFVFRLVNDRLQSSSWDRDVFGSREFRLKKEGDSGDDNGYRPDRDIEGDYYWERSGADGQQVVTLSLSGRGRAQMIVESSRYGSRPITSNGTWDLARDGKIEVSVTRPNGRDRWTLRRSGNRLTATNWDRNDWGRNTPEFNKNRKPPINPVDDAEGIWVWTRRAPGGDERITLSLSGRGRADWLEELNRNDRVSGDGTWSWDRDEIKVRISRRRDTLTFRFRVERNRLVATQWDRDEWGRTAPEFRRR
jgi:hypothetical protein